jgi:hypothetical protein
LKKLVRWHVASKTAWVAYQALWKFLTDGRL